MKVWHFKVKRTWGKKNEWGEPNDMYFAFKVLADNVIAASFKAWKRIEKVLVSQADLFNSDYSEQVYEYVMNENYMSACLWNKADDKCICMYHDFELLNEQEYDSLDDTVDKELI